jgi:hypothetical protein
VQRDAAIVEKYSKLIITSITIKVTNTDKRKEVPIVITHSNGTINSSIRPQDSINDAVERAYNICLKLTDKSKISLSKRASDILSEIGKLRELP